MLVRGMRNPWLRPFVLLFLCLLLGLVFVHVLHDGHDVLAGVGAACVAIALFFAFTLIIRVVRAPAGATLIVHSARPPPSLDLAAKFAFSSAGSAPLRL